MSYCSIYTSSNDEVHNRCDSTLPPLSTSTTGHLSALFGWFQKHTPSQRIQPVEDICDQDTSYCTFNNSSKIDVTKADTAPGGWRWMNKPMFSFLYSHPHTTTTTTASTSNCSMKSIEVIEEKSNRVRGNSNATINTNNTGTTSSGTSVNPLP